ncbi:MAG TPA: nodulation protein NfeD [Bryobacteraceae bacterium]|nr:nodulation protein NfeD [Bryobacteraceae bacterium]
MKQKAFLIPLLLAQACLGASGVVGVTVHGVVHPITTEIVGHAIEQAKVQDAALLLIRINTPGGLMEATREITEKIVTSPIPVVTYVAPSGARAASAGFFILESGDVAAMAPGTNTGAASPIVMGREMDPVMRKKVENDAAAQLRTLAGRRGRNSELAEKAVFEAKSFTEEEALKSQLIELIATDDRDLLQKLDGREIVRFSGARSTLQVASAEITEYQPSLRERVMLALANPNTAFILLILGALGIYVEFSSPGLIFPGVLGGILAILGLSALSVLPINWAGAALIVLALALFVLEANVTSHGILGIGGAVAMVLGALLLIEGPPEMRINLTTAIAVTLPFALITIFLVSLVMRARKAKVVTGDIGMVGEAGHALTPLSPGGKVFVRGEYWDAIATVPVEAGAQVIVTAVKGLRLTVEPFR